MGELVAFCCVCTLILEYVLANAAVARSFAPYFGQLIHKGVGYFVFDVASERARAPAQEKGRASAAPRARRRTPALDREPHF